MLLWILIVCGIAFAIGAAKSKRQKEGIDAVLERRARRQREADIAAGNPAPPADFISPDEDPDLVAIRRRYRTRNIIIVTTSAAVIATIVAFTAFNIYTNKTFPVVLVNGMNMPYAITVDDEQYKLTPEKPHAILSLKRGAHKIHAGIPRAGNTPLVYDKEVIVAKNPDGGPSDVLIINPDELAIIYNERRTYRHVPNYVPGLNDWMLSGEGNPPENINADISIHLNKDNIYSAAPDYLFVQPPAVMKTMRFKGDTSDSHYTIMDLLPRGASLSDKIGLIGKVATNASAAKTAHMHRLFELYDDMPELSDEISACVFSTDEIKTIFKPMLEARPVRINWHLAYMSAVRRHAPETDLATVYKNLAANEPDDKALSYLASRTAATVESRGEYLQKAAQAPAPVAQALHELAIMEATAGRIEAALVYINLAAGQNYKDPEFILFHSKMLFAAARPGEALACNDEGVRLYPKKYTMLKMQAHLMGICGRPKSGVQSLAQSYLRRHGGDPRDARFVTALLDSAYDYGKGDADACADNTIKTITEYFAPNRLGVALPDFSKKQGKNTGPLSFDASKTNITDANMLILLWQACVTKEDLNAVKTFSRTKLNINGVYHLLPYIIAMRKGQTAQAEQYWHEAMQTMGNDSPALKEIAMFIDGATPPPSEPLVAATHITADSKRIIFCALGFRYAQNSGEYFRNVLLFNHDPAFPRLLIEKATLRTRAEQNKTPHQ